MIARLPIPSAPIVRRWAARLGIAALLIQAVVVATHVVPMMGFATAAAPLCHNETNDAHQAHHDALHPPTPDQPSPGRFCPICVSLLAAGPAPLPPAGMLPAPPHGAALFTLAAADESGPRTIGFPAARPRAPPIVL